MFSLRNLLSYALCGSHLNTYDEESKLKGNTPYPGNGGFVIIGKEKENIPSEGLAGEPESCLEVGFLNGSTFIAPPNVAWLQDICESTEWAMSSIYKLCRFIIPSNNAAPQPLVNNISMARKEFYTQCENMANGLRYLMNQSHIYVQFVCIMSSSSGINPEKAEEERRIISQVTYTAMDEMRKIRIVLQGNLSAFNDMRQKFLEQVNDSSSNPTEDPGMFHQYHRLMSKLVPLEAEKRKLHKLRRDVLPLVEDLCERMSRLVKAIKELELHYQATLNHLNTLAFIPYSRSKPEDLTNLKKVNSDFQSSIDETISRLLRSADAVGQS